MAAAALLIRVGIWSTLWGTSALALNDAPDTDMRFFAEWAEEIGDGDWLTDQSLHPVHSWHMQVATTYFRENPDRIRDFTPDDGILLFQLAPEEQMQRRILVAGRLWDHWYAQKRFHQEPLYPYAVAVASLLPGGDRVALLVLQALMGVGTILLLHVVTRRLFGDLAALIACVLALLYPPLPYFELFLLRATPLCFASLAIAWALDRHSRDSRRLWIVAGLIVGVASLLRTTFLAVGLLVAALLPVLRKDDRRGTLRHSATLVVGMILPLIPAFARNATVDAPLFDLSSVAAITFAGVNHHGYEPGRGWVVDPRALARIMKESEGSTGATVSETVGSHPDMGSWCGLVFDKFLAIWHDTEYPNNTNVEWDTQVSWVMQFMPVSFGLIAALSLVGMGLAVWRRRGSTVLWTLVVLGVAQLTLLYTLTRFRVVLVVALLPFAGFAVAQVYTAIRARHWGVSGASVAAAILVFVFSVRDDRALLEPVELVTRGEIYQRITCFFGPRWKAAMAEEDWEGSLEIMAQVHEQRPPFIDALGPRRKTRDIYEYEIGLLYSEVYNLIADAAIQIGDQKRATEARQRARELTQSLRHPSKG